MLRTTSPLFKDKTTLILRELFKKPDKKWSMRALAVASETSTGLVSRAIGLLRQLGYVETGGLGRGGFVVLKERKQLLELWVQHYDFSLNKIFSFYSTEKLAIHKIVNHLNNNKIRYAMTLHACANLLTSYFPFDEYHIYVDAEDIEKLAVRLSSKISLKRLTKGGNIHFIKPYYKTSAYHHMRHVQDFNIVSNLQLYLDLYNFAPRGNEHANYLREKLGDLLYE